MCFCLTAHVEGEITTSYCNNTCQIQAQSNANVLPFRPAIANTAIVVAYLDSKIDEITTSSYTASVHIEHQRSNLSTHAATKAYTLFVQSQHDTHDIHSTNKDQRRAAMHRHCSVFGQHMMRIRLLRRHTAITSEAI